MTESHPPQPDPYLEDVKGRTRNPATPERVAAPAAVRGYSPMVSSLAAPVFRGGHHE